MKAKEAEVIVSVPAETEAETVVVTEPAVMSTSVIVAAIDKIPVHRESWAAQDVGPSRPVKAMTMQKPNGPKTGANGPGGRLVIGGPQVGNALTRAGPLGYASALVKSWYEQMVDEEEAEKERN
ncbi:unnamed protein product [Cochlearia groenlandica]